MKTGYTENAGYCLITSARRGERRLLSVVLGTASEAARAAESQKLLNYGFQYYDSVKLYEKNQAVSACGCGKACQQVKAGFLYDLYVSLPKGAGDKAEGHPRKPQPLVAPIAGGQNSACCARRSTASRTREFPVVALKTLPLAGVFGRGWDNPAVIQISRWQ